MTHLNEEEAPEAVPLTYPLPEVATYPLISRFAKKEVSRVELGVPLRLKYIE
jgi:hypothetical protein